MKNVWIIVLLAAGLLCLGFGIEVFGQEEAAAAAEGGGEVVKTGFFSVVMGGGAFGVVLWLAIFLCSIAGVALIVDSFITIQEKKIVPEQLVANVQEAMEQGDLMKAFAHCESEPSPLADVLSAGFSNVEEGYDVVQEAVTVASEMEGEKLLQRVNYLNVVGNLAPMLGLLGTVQGMILAFATLGTGAGAAKQTLLAMNISQALYTTAAGLTVAIPAVAFFSFFRNRAMKIILGMEALTMDTLKALRHVEVVEE